MLLHQETTQTILDAFFVVYNRLGYGFSESIYAAALQYELRRAGLKVAREVNVSIWYEPKVRIGRGRLDMLVEDKIIVENKAAHRFPKDVETQVNNYLRATSLEVALLLNYGRQPEFRRYLCTKDRKLGYDLREGSTAEFRVPG